MIPTEVDVVVSGAGVGGAMLALALGRAGVRVLLAEPGTDIPTRGAEILKPRGIRILRGYGVLPTLLRTGALFRDRIRYYHDGQPLLSLDFAEHSDLGYFLIAPYRHIAQSLLQACAAQPSVRVVFAAAVANIGSDEQDGHVVHLADGQRARATVVVGADGPRSPVLDHLGADLTVHTYDHVLWAATMPTPHADRHENRLYVSSSRSVAYLYPLDTTTMRVFLALAPALGHQLVDRPSALLVEHLSSFVPNAALLPRLADLTWQKVPVGSWQAPRVVRGSIAVLGQAAFSAHPMTGLGMSVTLEDATIIADAIIAARSAGQPPGELFAQRYAPRQEEHRRLIAYGDALATSYPDAITYRRRIQPRLHCGDR